MPRNSVRPFRRRWSRGWWIVALGAVLIALRWAARPSPEPEVLDAGLVQVARVVDGDTLRLADSARVRLVGIDAPEMPSDRSPAEPWAAEATEFARKFVARADGRVRLEFDRERRDRFGRFLAYVYSGEQMLNERLLVAGLARANTRYNYSESFKRRFRAAEQQAKLARRGIWSDDSAHSRPDEK